MTHEEIDAIVASPHAYGKDIKFARALYELAGGFFPEEHILCAVRRNIDTQERTLTGKGKAARAVHLSIEQLWNEYKNAPNCAEPTPQNTLSRLVYHPEGIVFMWLLYWTNSRDRLDGR